MINRGLQIGGLLVVLAACSSERAVRSYQLTGQILVVKPETNEVLVKHEDIPGFMPAMTMPYLVDDPVLLQDRAPGDVIIATLEVGAEHGRYGPILRERHGERGDRGECSHEGEPGLTHGIDHASSLAVAGRRIQRKACWRLRGVYDRFGR